MAEVTVASEVALAGGLPLVCVKTGRPATRLVRFRTTSGGVGIGQVLALLLLGPFGLLVGDRGGIVVLLPMSDESTSAMRRRRRARSVGTASAMLLAVGAVLAAFVNVLSLLLLLAIAAMLAVQWRAERAGVGVVLDRSGQWVTLGGVHPDFVAAVDAERRSTR